MTRAENLFQIILAIYLPNLVSLGFSLVLIANGKRRKQLDWDLICCIIMQERENIVKTVAM